MDVGVVVLVEVRQTQSLTAFFFGLWDELKNSAISRSLVLVFLCGVLLYVRASRVFRDKDSNLINQAGCFRIRVPPLAASMGQFLTHDSKKLREVTNLGSIYIPR